MTGAEIQAAYFTPFHYVIYLLIILSGTILYYQWAWTKKVDHYVKVLVVKIDGSTDTEYAPKSGNYVALKVPESNTTRLWPINKLSAIETLYPGDGLVPLALQKKIKTVIVDDEDWEPLLNRGSYSSCVASPDVVRTLRNLADSHPAVARELEEFADTLTTAPTREMVASPAVLGNVMAEKVSEMAVRVSQDALDKLEGLRRKLDKIPSSTAVYVGLGVLVVLGVVGFILAVTQILPALKDIVVIKAALGVP